MFKKYSKTNLFLIDEDLWNWAKYQSSIKGFESTSEYIFDLIKWDKIRKNSDEQKKVILEFLEKPIELSNVGHLGIEIDGLFKKYSKDFCCDRSEVNRLLDELIYSKEIIKKGTKVHHKKYGDKWK